MSLRWRLLLGFSLTLLLAVLGLGALLYAITAQSLERSFRLELQTLARQYAQLALQAEQVSLREPPPSPLAERLGNVSAFLLRPDKTIQETLGSSQDFMLPTSAWQTLERNQETVAGLNNFRAAAAFPIFSSSGVYQLAFVVVVAADDLSGASSLEQLRTSIVLWASAATLIALLLGQVLTSWLLRPLRQIASTAAAVSSGNLTARIPNAARPDEIGALKRDLNAMLVRLEHLVEAQRRFTANAAHDLRTPIAVLRTELEVALRRPREAAAYREVLERVLERCKSLGVLTEDLLALARLEAGLEKPVPLVLQQALSSTIETYTRAAEQQQKTFYLELPADLEIIGDTVALNRIFANLLGNALRFAKQEFGLRAERNAETISIRVWDDGTGIPESQHKQLFDRFQKGTHSSGTGLGLAIAQEATRAHNGTISLELSQTGAVFLVQLPSSNPRLTQTQYNPTQVKS